jgi:hypothetical protein
MGGQLANIELQEKGPWLPLPKQTTEVMAKSMQEVPSRLEHMQRKQVVKTLLGERVCVWSKVPAVIDGGGRLEGKVTKHRRDGLSVDVGAGGPFLQPLQPPDAEKEFVRHHRPFFPHLMVGEAAGLAFAHDSEASDHESVHQPKIQSGLEVGFLRRKQNRNNLR